LLIEKIGDDLNIHNKGRVRIKKRKNLHEIRAVQGIVNFLVLVNVSSSSLVSCCSWRLLKILGNRECILN